MDLARGGSARGAQARGRKDLVSVDVFEALDLRVGIVTEVHAFPEARKPAWRLTVDFGPAVGVLSTSAQVTNYDREELLGRVVVGAVNLFPKRVAGFVSEFLLLGAMELDGRVRLLSLPDDVSVGAAIA
ncbi:MAG TPA: tRNA-binding protein [Acidimicrobiales bacterium]|nr:tRNA-binding protein [Acidimicrobiales bacterium]